MTRNIILSLLLLLSFRLSISSGYGQTAKTYNGIDSISLYFEGIRGQQQEKLWLHLNQPYYAAGDTIWFRAYLIDAMTHQTKLHLCRPVRPRQTTGRIPKN